MYQVNGQSNFAQDWIACDEVYISNIASKSLTLAKANPNSQSVIIKKKQLYNVDGQMVILKKKEITRHNEVDKCLFENLLFYISAWIGMGCGMEENSTKPEMTEELFNLPHSLDYKG